MYNGEKLAHKEAYCLMQYQTIDKTETEILWNSRDGVTPFIITSRTGKEMRHVNWQSDVRVPYFQPAAGMRIFVDSTPELIKESLNAYMDKHCPDGFYGKNREEAYKSLEESWLHDGKAPWIKVVD
jgi:hypothetical protein